MLLTHHQVMPSFLDLVLAFNPSSKPPSHAMFKHENYLERDSAQFVVPGRARSGRQIQCAFNLLSVEPADAPNEGNPWPLRQTALCHTFDVVSGQSLFIVLKADTNILQRIHQEALKNPEMQPSSFLEAGNSFAATLLVQLIVVEWCAENWADYIEYFETKVRDKSIEGKLAPISAATTSMAIEMDLSRRSTTPSPVASRKGTFPRQTTFGRDSRPPTSHLTQLDTRTPELPSEEQGQSQPASPTWLRSPPRRRTSSLRQSVAVMFARASSSQSKEAVIEDIEMGHREGNESDMVEYDLDEKLSFEEFQRMNRWGSELEQSILVIGQNLGVLEQLQRHYREAIESHDFKQHIKREDVSGRISAFFRRIDGVVRDLLVHRERLQAVTRTLENDKAMVRLFLVASPQAQDGAYADLPSSPVVRRCAAVRKRPGIQALCRHGARVGRPDGRLDPANAQHRHQDGARDGVDARHNHLHAHLPPRDLCCSKIRLATRSTFDYRRPDAHADLFQQRRHPVGRGRDAGDGLCSEAWRHEVVLYYHRASDRCDHGHLGDRLLGRAETEEGQERGCTVYGGEAQIRLYSHLYGEANEHILDTLCDARTTR